MAQQPCRFPSTGQIDESWPQSPIQRFEIPQAWTVNGVACTPSLPLALVALGIAGVRDVVGTSPGVIFAAFGFACPLPLAPHLAALGSMAAVGGRYPPAFVPAASGTRYGTDDDIPAAGSPSASVDSIV